MRQFFRNLDPKVNFKKFQFNRKMKTFYRQFVGNDDLCFDIGANIGNRVGIFLSLGARVVALEPQPDCVEILKRKYGKKEQVTVLPFAAGQNEGESDMYVSNSTTISSMSRSWIDAVKQNRFKDLAWNKTIKVKVTTLDALINKFGCPKFIKIDVEGYEENVVYGLSSKVKAMSLEFTPEYNESTIQAIEHLSKLAACEFNFSAGETMVFCFDAWVSGVDMVENVKKRKNEFESNGDIYVRFL